MSETCRNIDEVLSSKAVKEYQSEIDKHLSEIEVSHLLHNIDLLRRGYDVLSNVGAIQSLNRIYAEQVLGVFDLVLKEASQPAKASTALQLADLKALIILNEIKTKEGMGLVWSASVFDFANAAKNAFCTNEIFSFPGAAFIDTPMGKVSQVSHRESPILFSHLISQSSRQSPENYSRIVKDKAAVIKYEYYIEYLEILQSMARYFKANAETLRGDLSDIVSAVEYFHKEKIGTSMSESIKPMLSYRGGEEGRVVFQLPGVESKYKYTFELGKDGKVLIPGAGIVSLQEIPKFAKQSTVSFELNDSNGFVADTLQKLANLHGAENINASDCGMEDLDYEKDSISLIVMSLIHNAGFSNLSQFAEKASSFLKKDGTILVYSPDEKTDPSQVDTQSLISIFLKAGFRVTKSEKVQMALISDTISNPELSKDLLESSANECINRGIILSTTKKQKHVFTILSFQKSKKKS